MRRLLILLFNLKQVGFFLLNAMAKVDVMREKLELWRQRTGQKPMRRFSFIAEYWPTDLSVRLTTLLVGNDKGSKSTVKRKPFCCINRFLNQINEQLNIKLHFDNDFLIGMIILTSCFIFCLTQHIESRYYRELS